MKKVIGVELDKERISYAEHNCCIVYEIPKKKVQFINKSISEINFSEDLKLESEDLQSKVVFFFDPPWGGLSY